MEAHSEAATHVLLGAVEVQQYPAVCAHGLHVATAHDEREADVVEQRDVAGRHSGEQCLVLEVERRDDAQRLGVVADKAVQPAQAHEAEVAELVQQAGGQVP